jgi:hypothetical protein
MFDPKIIRGSASQGQAIPLQAIACLLVLNELREILFGYLSDLLTYSLYVTRHYLSLCRCLLRVMICSRWIRPGGRLDLVTPPAGRDGRNMTVVD